MANLTTNYGFKKPLYTEAADIGVINDNFDLLDAELTPMINQTLEPPFLNQKGKVSVILNWIANRIKAITGKANWWEAPAVTLEAAAQHIGSGTHNDATNSTSGFMSTADKGKLDNATSAPTPSTMLMRDSAGRAQVTAPVVSNDIVNKQYADSSFVSKNSPSTMTAQLTAQSNTSYTTKQVRNIVIWQSGSTPPPTSYGDLVIKVF